MSIKSLLANIWRTIKRLFDSLDPDLQQAILIGITVTENIKNFVDSPATDLITELIPGDLDDRIKGILRKEIPIILNQLRLVSTASNQADQNSTVRSAIATINDTEINVKNAFLHDISILIAQVAADDKLTWSDAVYLMQWYYEHRFKSTNA